MELFWKITTSVLIASILCLSIGKGEKDIAAMLAVAVCCMAGYATVYYIEPVLDLLYELESMASTQGTVLEILIRAVGVALITELGGLVCSDAGSASLGKALQIVGSAVILYLSIPLVETFLDLIRGILSEI